jgi:hypothetical protein
MVDVEIPKHTVIQYVRDRKRVPYGVLVAVKRDGGFGVGYSLCNKKDRFSKKMALKIALGRTNYSNEVSKDPYAIVKMLPDFVERCKKYYKS